MLEARDGERRYKEVVAAVEDGRLPERVTKAGQRATPALWHPPPSTSIHALLVEGPEATVCADDT